MITEVVEYFVSVWLGNKNILKIYKTIYLINLHRYTNTLVSQKNDYVCHQPQTMWKVLEIRLQSCRETRLTTHEFSKGNVEGYVWDALYICVSIIKFHLAIKSFVCRRMYTRITYEKKQIIANPYNANTMVNINSDRLGMKLFNKRLCSASPMQNSKFKTRMKNISLAYTYLVSSSVPWYLLI